MVTINLVLLAKIISLICLASFMIILIKGTITAKDVGPFILAILMLLIPFIYIIVRDYV